MTSVRIGFTQLRGRVADLGGMTAPRRVLPGDVLLITRRVSQRMFLLKPDAGTKAIFAYCIAEAARRYKVEVVAWVVMSNHYHAVVYDPLGKVPAFIEHLHKMLAKCVNHRYERWENVWSTEETCVTRLVTPQDVFDAIVYVLANPVAAHLVDRAVEWPGFSSIEYLDGKTTEHERPKWYFSAKSRVMPPKVTLRAERPPPAMRDVARETRAEWAARVRAAVAQKEREYRELRRKKRIVLPSRKSLVDVSPTAKPSTKARHRKLRPALACADPVRRSAELAALKGFRVEYARKLKLFAMEGRAKVVFPPGTYRLRALGARCRSYAPLPRYDLREQRL
jgi:REP element-mobilizing transposase RayT